MQKAIALAPLLAVLGCSPAPQVAIDEPDPELNLLGGYRSGDDECRRAGESAFTIDFLDDAADLVACPTGSADAASLAATLPAQMVTQTQSYTLYSVARR
ncbi:hypothetical protein [Oceanomicrobium pacificus]|uniref:Uncharacterized protein n=1 Tax=Oceanomicrobium pacificus TaxID=2692916 RepID=A0A6B0TWL5_9RHOB|nr:hypothetical protein [Oceanomicrobium pacificus]MXU66135.1 hypothetical protein [Oceanomicrobium pacificus]